MFHDSRRLDDGAEIRVDVCIVGAGAAGIALARELLGQPVRVALLTSGDFEFQRRPQRLYAGENIGRSGYSTYQSRVRMFGGSTTRWAGQCRPLERIDFERLDYGTSDPLRTGAALSRKRNEVSELIPGIGAAYRLGDADSLFAGVHRGFAPPGPLRFRVDR